MAMERFINKICKINDFKFIGYSEGIYHFSDKFGIPYYLTQSQIREFCKKR